jgi:Acetyltransferase (GNAT) family.
VIIFKKVEAKDEIMEISKLAKIIQEEHFTPIIGAEQVDYMLKKFQSEDAIARQISNGYEYISVYKDKELAGYFAVKQEGDRLFLSKFYLDKKYRGLGISKKMFDEVTRYSQGVSTIYLTVNRNNIIPINVYKSFGFVIVDSVVQDIGNGFVMDDYVMEKKVPA